MDPKEKARTNTIAQIDVNVRTTYRDQFVEDYNHCPLCGTELTFTHVTKFADLQVCEEAHCDACNVRTKTQSHKLQ